MEPTLPTLATELVELIACWLGPADLCSLRLVCKDLRQKSKCVFGACFTTIRIDYSQKSLQKLQQISEVDNLRLYVQKLLIKGREREELGRGFQWQRHSSGYLEAPLPGFEKLQYLLAHNLPNCRSFHIWGRGCGPHDKFDTFRFNDMVALILRMVPFLSIEASNSLPVKSFILGCTTPDHVGRPRHGNGIVDVKRLQTWQDRQPSFREAWAHIQELSLHQVLRMEMFDWGIDLILDATSLRKLSVNVGYSLSRSFLARLCHATSLSNLESFKLACAHPSVEILSRLIGRLHDPLRVFSLSHISLERLTDWSIVLERLGKQAPFLHSVFICMLTTATQQRITFPSLGIDPVVPESGGREFTLMRDDTFKEIIGVAYQGPRADKAMDKLAKVVDCYQLYPNWSRPP